MKQITLVIITVTFLFYTLIHGSCKKEEPPTLKTLSVSEIAATTAKSGGNITDDGGSDINSKGIVWGITPEPTVDHYTGITMEGAGKGIFKSTLTNLAPETQYYVRAYASNSAGIVYGNQEAFSTTKSTSPNYPPWYVHCDPDNPTAVVDVISPMTGQIWMDRNLGASQAATSLTDINAYGDLYQWGRFADGHQCRTSVNTANPSNSDVPGHGDFITSSQSALFDWRRPRNNYLWQGLNGVNNPCPIGYRLPTRTELFYEFLSWSPRNSDGAFDSPLRLPNAGYREAWNGTIYSLGFSGKYWSGSTANWHSHNISFSGSYVDFRGSQRAMGYSVRCIKD